MSVHSLRHSLLRRLAAPLSLLALASGLIAYWLAWQYTERVVDRSLIDLATAVAQQVRLSGPAAPTTVPSLARAMFADPVEQLVYRISDGNRNIAGDPRLPLGGTPVRRLPNRADILEAEFEGSSVRFSQIAVPQQSGPPIIIEVGQRVGRRYRLAAEFLAAIMLPLLLLLLAGWGIVWRVVNQQLIPLTALADSLNRQTHTSLEPVDETYVPAEIRPLTGALNALLERLKTALEAQRKFIADASHQLRTPLTAIKLHAEQASHARDAEQTRSALRELRSSADRAVRLSNQLLSLARAEPGAQAKHFSDVDVAALAFETGAEWVPRALAYDVDLGFQRLDPTGRPNGSDAGPLLVHGHAVLLREVIGNLIDNALKYVPPHRSTDRRVTMLVRGVPDGVAVPDNAETQPGFVEIVVEDNGPGVPAVLQPDLFKRFFRGDAHANGGDGAGLGLAIVHDIVALHGGGIFYEDGAEGGSRFVVRLPLRRTP